MEGGEGRPRVAARFLKGHFGGIADDAPGTGSLMLALHEIAFDAGAAHADAETLEFRVADIEGFLAGFEGVDLTLGKTGIGHDILPVFVAPQEQKGRFCYRAIKLREKNSNIISQLAPLGADLGVTEYDQKNLNYLRVENNSAPPMQGLM